MDQEMKHPMTEAEERRCKAGTPRKTITEERIWNKRPVGLAIKMPTSETVGEFVILEIKRMSDVTDQYVTRAKNVAVAQYASIKSALERTLGPQGWSMSQRSFIAGARSLNEQDLYSTRFNGCPRDNTDGQTDSAPCGPVPPLITSKLGSLITLGVQRIRRRRGLDSINLY
jgi:hypothetical protein